MIRKRKFLVTVLERSEDPLDLSPADDGDPFDLLAIHQAIYDGPCLGNVEELPSEDVPPEKVEAECLALGNDGEFFLDDSLPANGIVHDAATATGMYDRDDGGC